MPLNPSIVWNPYNNIIIWFHTMEYDRIISLFLFLFLFYYYIMALSTLGLTSSIIRFNNFKTSTVGSPPTDNLLIYLKFLASDYNSTYKLLLIMVV